MFPLVLPHGTRGEGGRVWRRWWGWDSLWFGQFWRPEWLGQNQRWRASNIILYGS